MNKVYADELYFLLSEIAEAAVRFGESNGLNQIEFARKHYVFPLTSEFLGVSMDALTEILQHSRGILTPVQVRRAEQYVLEIRTQWFPPVPRRQK